LSSTRRRGGAETRFFRKAFDGHAARSATREE
jgi:hypothetical protein